MHYRRAISTVATTAAFCVVASQGWAQQAGDQNSGPMNSLTRFFNFDPLLVAAFVIAMTLVIGLGLDALRGRFRKSEDNQAPTAS